MARLAREHESLDHLVGVLGVVEFERVADRADPRLQLALTLALLDRVAHRGLIAPLPHDQGPLGHRFHLLFEVVQLVLPGLRRPAGMFHELHVRVFAGGLERVVHAPDDVLLDVLGATGPWRK